MPNLPPLYLYALQESEIELLRQIVVESVTGEEKLFRQSQFMGDGGDIRNFIKTPNARPNPQFLASIYNYVMTNIYPQLSSLNINHMSSKTKMILSLIDDLISLGALLHE